MMIVGLCRRCGGWMAASYIDKHYDSSFESDLNDRGFDTKEITHAEFLKMQMCPDVHGHKKGGRAS